MQVLRRGRSKRVDMFLDWLVSLVSSISLLTTDTWQEKGAFIALKDGNLHAVQVYVHADRNDRDKIIETYTFTVRYLHGKDDKRKLAGIEIDTPESSFVSGGATNSALQDLLRKVIGLCSALPDLPGGSSIIPHLLAPIRKWLTLSRSVKRYVSMALFYVPESERLYQPKGFIEGSADGLVFADAEDWERRTETLDDLQSAFHR